MSACRRTSSRSATCARRRWTGCGAAANSPMRAQWLLLVMLGLPSPVGPAALAEPDDDPWGGEEDDPFAAFDDEDWDDPWATRGGGLSWTGFVEGGLGGRWEDVENLDRLTSASCGCAPRPATTTAASGSTSRATCCGTTSSRTSTPRSASWRCPSARRQRRRQARPPGPDLGHGRPAVPQRPVPEGLHLLLRGPRRGLPEVALRRGEVSIFTAP
jgi:hypothetical protein